MSGTTYDDPNREVLGLPPIWTGAGGEEPVPPPAPSDPPPAPELPGHPEVYTVAEIQAWVDNNPQYAADVLAHEQARGEQARVTLINWLQSFIAEHGG